MPHKLILICAAQPNPGKTPRFHGPDAPLPDAALVRAAQVAARLRHVDRAWRGPDTGARRTAQALGLTAEPLLALAGQDPGLWAGRTLEEVMAEDPSALAAWMQGAAPPGGESVEAICARISDWLRGMDGLSGRSVVVASVSVIRAAVVWVLDAPPAAFGRLDITPLSLTTLTSDGRRWALRSLGCRPAAAWG